MAHEVIAKTHKNKEPSPCSTRPSNSLSKPGSMLATNGSQEDTRALYDDAQALYRRDPSSLAAADAAFAVARLAHTNAQASRTDPRLIQEFAIQARTFATRFQKDAAGRAAALGGRPDVRAVSHGCGSSQLLCPLAGEFCSKPPSGAGDGSFCAASN